MKWRKDKETLGETCYTLSTPLGEVYIFYYEERGRWEASIVYTDTDEDPVIASGKSPKRVKQAVIQWLLHKAKAIMEDLT